MQMSWFEVDLSESYGFAESSLLGAVAGWTPSRAGGRSMLQGLIRRTGLTCLGDIHCFRSLRSQTQQLYSPTYADQII